LEEFSSSFKKEGERDSSAESRFDIWRAGMQITGDYPLLGVGPWAGQRLVPQYLGLPLQRKGLHNLFFEISTGCGVPALIFYLTYFAVGWTIAVRALWRRKREPLPEWAEIAYLATASGLFGYFVSSMFSSGALLESSYMLCAFALATSLILRRRNREDFEFDLHDEFTELSNDSLFALHTRH
jgi:O-antigen ligase